MRVRVWFSRDPDQLAHEWAGVDRVEHHRDGVVNVYSKTNLIGSFSEDWLWIVEGVDKP